MQASSYCLDVNNCLEASLDIQYIGAVAQGVETTYWYQGGSASSSDMPFLWYILNVSSTATPPLVHSISYGGYEFGVPSNIIKAWDIETMKLGLRGISVVAAAGDDGVTGYVVGSSGYTIATCGFYPQWPASSKYVTSVGATMGGLGNDGTTETACSAAQGSVITTGGGFSSVISAPAHQTAAVAAYLALTRPTNCASSNSTSGCTKAFVPTNRAYPGIVSGLMNK
jgi:tripeptidyl-peptidase-1